MGSLARKPTIVTSGFNNELARALEPVKQSVEMITGARAGFAELTGLPLNTSSVALFGKINEIIARINASGGYKPQADTSKAPLSDAGVQPEDLKFLPLTGGTLTGPVVGTTFTATNFIGRLDGNASTATSATTATTATKDSSGNVISSTYLKLTGGTLTGALSGTTGTFSGALKGQSIQSTSDRRLKKHITNYTADISKLRAKSYMFKKGDSKYHVGLIAQDVREAIPEAVSESNGQLALDYNAVVAVLVNKVNALEKEIKCLTNTLSRLAAQ